jgi:uncharacterized membrane protein
MRLTWRTEWPHWLLLAVLLLVLTLSPEDLVPIHWGLSGRPDAFADKRVVFGLASAVYLLLAHLPRFDPGRANYAQFAGAYTVIRIAVLTVLVVLTGSGAIGLRGEGLPHVAVGALLVVFGSVMGKLRPNWFVGIRTPWTLASKRAWLKTHRLGGWLFIAWGVVEMLVGWLVPSASGLTPALALVLLAILVVYSYLVWHDDPDKLPAAGTRPADSDS